MFESEERILNWQQVSELTCISVPTLRRLSSNEPSFPKARQISPYRVGFLKSEVMAWIKDRPRANLNCRANQQN